MYMSYGVDREPASDQELARRKEAMASVGRKFLDKHPDTVACVFVGSVLMAPEPGDTDVVIIGGKSFTMTPEEVDRDLRLECGNAGLPHPDTFEVVKIGSKSTVGGNDVVDMLPEDCPYGVFVVNR